MKYESPNKLSRLVVCMSPKMKRQIKASASELGMSASQYVRMCVDIFRCEREGKRP